MAERPEDADEPSAPEQLALQAFHVDFSDAMQGADETRLVEISHNKILARGITSINRTLLKCILVESQG